MFALHFLTQVALFLIYLFIVSLAFFLNISSSYVFPSKYFTIGNKFTWNVILKVFVSLNLFLNKIFL